MDTLNTISNVYHLAPLAWCGLGLLLLVLLRRWNRKSGTANTLFEKTQKSAFEIGDRVVCIYSYYVPLVKGRVYYVTKTVGHNIVLNHDGLLCHQSWFRHAKRDELAFKVGDKVVFLGTVAGDSSSLEPNQICTVNGMGYDWFFGDDRCWHNAINFRLATEQEIVAAEKKEKTTPDVVVDKQPSFKVGDRVVWKGCVHYVKEVNEKGPTPGRITINNGLFANYPPEDFRHAKPDELAFKVGDKVVFTGKVDGFACDSTYAYGTIYSVSWVSLDGDQILTPLRYCSHAIHFRPATEQEIAVAEKVPMAQPSFKAGDRVVFVQSTPLVGKGQVCYVKEVQSGWVTITHNNLGYPSEYFRHAKPDELAFKVGDKVVFVGRVADFTCDSTYQTGRVYMVSGLFFVGNEITTPFHYPSHAINFRLATEQEIAAEQPFKKGDHIVALADYSLIKKDQMYKIVDDAYFRGLTIASEIPLSWIMPLKDLFRAATEKEIPTIPTNSFKVGDEVWYNGDAVLDRSGFRLCRGPTHKVVEVTARGTLKITDFQGEYPIGSFCHVEYFQIGDEVVCTDASSHGEIPNLKLNAHYVIRDMNPNNICVLDEKPDARFYDKCRFRKLVKPSFKIGDKVVLLNKVWPSLEVGKQYIVTDVDTSRPMVKLQSDDIERWVNAEDIQHWVDEPTFKVGDKVICVNSTPSKTVTTDNLKFGEIYTVAICNGDYVQVDGINGIDPYYYKTRFQPYRSKA